MQREYWDEYTPFYVLLMFLSTILAILAEAIWVIISHGNIIYYILSWYCTLHMWMHISMEIIFMIYCKTVLSLICAQVDSNLTVSANQAHHFTGVFEVCQFWIHPSWHYAYCTLDLLSYSIMYNSGIFFSLLLSPKCQRFIIDSAQLHALWFYWCSMRCIFSTALCAYASAHKYICAFPMHGYVMQ